MRRIRFWSASLLIGAILLLAGWLLPMLDRRSPQYIRVNLKELGNFLLDPNAGTIKDIPAQFRALDGKRVETVGYAFSPVLIKSEHLNSGTEFQFVYNVQYPSYHGPPLVQERIFAKVLPGTQVEFPSDLAQIRGVFHVSLKRDVSGQITSLFQLDVESMRSLTDMPDETPVAVWIGTELTSLGTVALLIGLFAGAFRLIARMYRVVPGVCRECGYDLRASPERCPECGTENPNWIPLPRPITPLKMEPEPKASAS